MNTCSYYGSRHADRGKRFGIVFERTRRCSRELITPICQGTAGGRILRDGGLWRTSSAKR